MWIQQLGTKSTYIMIICEYNYLRVLIVIGISIRCNVDRLLILREALPLDGEFSHVWLRINKVIDQLHIGNHKVLFFHQY